MRSALAVKRDKSKLDRRKRQKKVQGGSVLLTMNYINKQTQSNLQILWVHIALYKSKLTLEINNTQTKSQLTTVNKLKLKLKLKKKN